MKPAGLLAVVTDYPELVEALIARRHALGLTQEELTARTGLCDRYVSKLEISHHEPAARNARALGRLSLPLLLGALNVRLALVPDAKAPPPTQQEWGRIGGQQRARRLTPDQRRESARAAALARWRRDGSRS